MYCARFVALTFGNTLRKRDNLFTRGMSPKCPLFGGFHCTLCGAECESVVHVLWECSSYSTCMDNFQEALKHLLGARYTEFKTLSAVEKTSYVLSKYHNVHAHRGEVRHQDDIVSSLHSNACK